MSRKDKPTKLPRGYIMMCGIANMADGFIELFSLGSKVPKFALKVAEWSSRRHFNVK